MRLVALLLFVVTSYGATAQCSAPNGIQTSNITATASLATWLPVVGASSYNVEYRHSSWSYWITIANATTSLQWHLYGMEPSSTYHWRVNANCSSGSSSFTETQFTTLALGSCNAPGGLYASNIASSTATLNWSAVSGALVYTVQYKPATSGSWLTAASGTSSPAVNLYGLTANTTYDWRVYTNCSLTEASMYSYSQFTSSGSTPPPPTSSACPGPEDIATNGNMGGAGTIGLNTEVKGLISGKIDIDYYKFTINTSGSFTVWLTNLPANYQLAVLNSSGTQLGISQNNGQQNEFVALNGNAGTYYAKVFPKGTANSRSCYTLKVQTATATRSTGATTNISPSATAATGATAELIEKPDFAVNLFPNPAGDQLNISVEGVYNKSNIKVYDLTGKLVMQQGRDNIITQMNISKLPAGFYVVHVNDGIETRTAKFVKQ